MAKEKIDKLPILPQGMNTKKPTWNNIRYFFRNVHYSEINKYGTCIQSEVESQLLGGLQRQEHYSRSIAVGNEVYIRHVQQVFGVRAVGRRAFKTVADEFQLRETISKYK